MHSAHSHLFIALMKQLIDDHEREKKNRLSGKKEVGSLVPNKRYNIIEIRRDNVYDIDFKYLVSDMY